MASDDAFPSLNTAISLEALVTAMPDGLLLLDSTGTIRFANDTAESIFGFGNDELLGSSCETLIPELLRHFDTAGDDPLNIELTGIKRNGALTPISGSVHWILADDKKVGIVALRDVSRVKRTEAALSKSETFALTILNSVSSNIAVLDKTGTIVQVNEPYRRFARENGGDSAVISAIGTNYLDAIQPGEFGDCADQARKGILDVIEGKEASYQLEYPCDSPDAKRWYLMKVEVMGGDDGGVVISHTDISERRLAEEEMRLVNTKLESLVEERTQQLVEKEARYSTLFHSTDEGFCIIEVLFDESDKAFDYRFLEVNPAFETHTGMQNAIGRTMRQFSPNLEEEWFESFGNIVRTGETMRIQRDAQDLKRHFDVYACRIGDPKAHLVAILFNDVTEKRNHELELKKAKEEAEQANRAKSEFLSRMSHELRTPLNAVLGYAQLLDLTFDDPKVKKATSSILRGGKHLLNMIDEILDFSRIESGNLAFSIEPVAMAGCLNQAINLIQPIADNLGITIHLDPNLCEKMHVLADRQRLTQVFVNLLSNATKYNRPNGHIYIRCLELPDDWNRIEIADTGYGISKKDQELLFQPFQRFGDTSVEGTGLGLSLTDRFVQMMGGSIGLASSSPEGSLFFVEFRKVKEIVLEPVAAGESAANLSIQSRRGKILYIEDNLSNLKLLESVFESWTNLELIPAMQGIIGLELAKQHLPDLILLDLHLPGLMGDQVLKRLKADPEMRSIPVAILSADATQKQIEKLLAAGADAYLTKPLDLKRLFDLLERHLPDDGNI